jgi:hypothetical protein
MTEYYPPETTVYCGGCHVIKIEAKFVRGIAVNARDTGARLGSWVQHFCVSHAATRKRRKTDHVRSGHTQRSPIVQGARRSIPGQSHQLICVLSMYYSVFSAVTGVLRPILASEDSALAHPTGIEQLLAFCAVVHDPRRQHAPTWPPLETLLTITILATIGGAQNWGEIAQGGHAKAAWLSEFLDLTHGIPSHETLGRVFALWDPSSLQQAFASWMQASADLRQDIVALDGKTLRRSLDRADGKGPMHLVNAWSSANALVLAQFKVDAKTNEITALPALLRMLNLTGAVVTIDAMAG